MRQIIMWKDIVRRYRPNISRRLIGQFVLYSLLIDCCCTRGPHHPKSEVKPRIKQQHINEHLDFKAEHIQEEIIEQGLSNEIKVEDLSEDELRYMHFKLHDANGDDKLDGLEILNALSHHKDDHNEHGHSGSGEKDEHHEHDASGDAKEHENTLESNVTSSDSEQNIELVHVDSKSNEDNNHLIGILDEILINADLDNDGFLNYAEFAGLKIELSKDILEAQQEHPEL